MSFQVLNNIHAPRHVLLALLNDKFEVDFGRVIPCHSDLTLVGDMNSLQIAEQAVDDLLSNASSTTLSQSQEQEVESKAFHYVETLKPTELNLFSQMMKNILNHGAKRNLDFNCKKWGAYTNAFAQVPVSINDLDKDLFFHTKVGTAELIISELSKMYPSETIHFRYKQLESDPFIGYVVFKNGMALERNERPYDETPTNKKYWWEFNIALGNDYDIATGKTTLLESSIGDAASQGVLF